MRRTFKFNDRLTYSDEYKNDAVEFTIYQDGEFFGSLNYGKPVDMKLGQFYFTGGELHYLYGMIKSDVTKLYIAFIRDKKLCQLGI